MSPKTETRKNRTPEQVVLDLEAKIAAVKARAASRQTKANPVGKALLLVFLPRNERKQLAMVTDDGVC